jgi:hypothetical protein
MRSPFEVTLRLTVSQSVCLGIEHLCGTSDQILLPVEMLLSEICGLVSVVRPLWREVVSAICSVITQWSESPRTLKHTLLSSLKLTQPGATGFRIYIHQEQGGPVIPPGTGLVPSWKSNGHEIRESCALTEPKGLFTFYSHKSFFRFCPEPTESRTRRFTSLS